MSDSARDAEKAERRAAKDAEKRARAVARSRARRGASGAELAVVPPEDEGDDKGEGRGLYWVMRNVLLGPPVKKIFSPIVEGADNVPEKGGAILAANHLSFADWVFMPLALDRRVTFVAKSDYFTGEGVKGWAQRRFFAGTGQVPIDRSGGRASRGGVARRPEGARTGRPVRHLSPRAPAATTVGCTRVGRVSRGWRWRPRCRSSRSAVIGTDVIAPPGKIVSKIVSPTVKFGTPAGLLPLRGDE